MAWKSNILQFYDYIVSCSIFHIFCPICTCILFTYFFRNNQIIIQKIIFDFKPENIINI